MRAGRAQIKEAYVFVKDGEAYIFGAGFTAGSIYLRWAIKQP